MSIYKCSNTLKPTQFLYLFSSGWWFQTCVIFHFIYGMSSFPLTNSISFFKMAIAPPTSQTFFFSISYMGIIISDLHIFQRGWSTTNQYTYSHNQVYNGNVSIQNGHLQLIQPLKMVIYPLKMVIYHSFSTKTPPKTLPKR